MKIPGVIEAFRSMHEATIRQGLEYFFSVKDPAIDATKFRCQISNPNIQLKEPFKYENFKLAANCLHLYGEVILRAGPSWLGYRFRSPIIWHPSPAYQALYEMPEGHTGHFFEHLVMHHRYRPPHEIPSPAYSLTALHVNYNVLMRARKRVSRGVCGVLKKV